MTTVREMDKNKNNDGCHHQDASSHETHHFPQSLMMPFTQKQYSDEMMVLV
jgi:hypothetical protein